MNCDWVKSNVTLYAFEELSDADRAEMDLHLGRCPGCMRELESEKQLRSIMDLRPKFEPSANLLESCRLDLMDALEEVPAPRAVESTSKWTEWLSAPFAGLRVQWQAGMAVALLSVGFISGTVVATRHSGFDNGDPSQANIAGVNSITQRPDGQLDITLDTTHRQTIHGTPNDPMIRKALVSALGDYNSGVRLESLEQLGNSSMKNDEQVRSALIAALKTDKNPGVRLKALNALAGSENDPAVRKALVGALTTDSNPGLRMKAIEMLSGKRDSAAINALQRLAEADSNSAIRLKSADTLRKWNAPVEVY